uniref:Insulin-degrading enzyme n=1 Tax=Phallusia mammillata TaxID=59560 RepID=A0A6F9DFG9_9ASCI|nr:insulin-degrading enzyme [Phallusia mammillata]
MKILSLSLNKISITRVKALAKRMVFSTAPASDTALLHQKWNSKLASIHDNIIKSESDKRSYRGIKLANGMKIMVVSDPKTDKSAASMDVNIGSLIDPIDLPGLAHFCEHMLFLGTEKYPDEAEYSKFLQEHAGSSNAFTSGEHTNYYFDIGHEHLKGILDRFSKFFICPLFDASCTDREVNAVHSEHEKNVMSDAWRLQRIVKATSDPTHPYAKFSTGNKFTLDTNPKNNNLCVRDELLKFHGKYYSANMMSMAVIGRETLDELSEMVLELFSDILNKDVKVPVYEKSPYTAEQLQTCVNVVPVKDLRNLMLLFPIPDFTEHYKSNPESYLGHLIGHEGPGSLLSELKQQGWVNALMAGSHGGARGFDFFLIQVDLTEDGMEHVDAIVTCMFQYIAMLRDVGPQEWVFNETKEISAMAFRFKDKQRPTSCVMKLSESMQYFPMEDAMSADALLSEYKPELINQIMERLVPENMRMTVVSKTFEGKTDQTEQWYGTNYKVTRISNENLQKWKNCEKNEKFHLPDRNEFIPTNFDILPLPSQSPKVPQIIKHTALSRLWFKQDDQFFLPKSNIMLELFSPISYISPQYCNMVYMFTELFKDALNEYAYAAEIAGLKYKLENSVYGLQLHVTGYNDKQLVLLTKILHKMSTFEIDSKRFEIIKEAYARALKNFRADQPYKHTGYYLRAIKCEKSWLKEELSDILPQLTIEMLQEFIPQFMKRLHLEMLVHGNISKEGALSLCSAVEEILRVEASTVALQELEFSRFRELQLPEASCHVFQHKHDIRDISAVEVYFQLGLQNTADNAMLMLLGQIMSEPCFNMLRTKEQLGYIVYSTVSRSNGVHGLKVVVQSERTPEYLEGRVEAFIELTEKLLEEMESAEFTRHVAALVSHILEKPKKLSTESLKHWIEIISEQHHFNRPEVEANHLRTVTKQDLQDFYRRHIRVGAPQRSKLCVHLLGNKVEKCSVKPDENAYDKDLLPCPSLPQPTVVTDIEKFKNSLQLFPRVQSYLDAKPAKL